ncbi:MAG: hypothetical protein HKN49_11890 [Gammaproteobacteria bacterium]|nr:hypothetical protein [Gammaproteobacteria bacterium]
MVDKQNLRWWGDFSVPAEQWSRWQVGPLHLFARAMTDEWRIAWRSEADADFNDVVIATLEADEPDTEDLQLARFALEHPGTDLRLTPRLADLPVVVTPETPLWIPPGETALLFVGTLVRIAIMQATDEAPVLMEIPIFRPSDTWFGANTRFGELCYASKTRARTRADLLGHMPHRAFTPVEIVNEGGDMFNVEQLRIPVTALHLYETDHDQLWTDAIRFTRKSGPNNAEFDIIGGSSHLPTAATELSKPRAPLQRKTVIQAFSSLFN